MAENIIKLKLDSGEYESKIKRATQGLLEMERECRSVGGTLAILEKDQKEFVRGLGSMETVARDTRGKLNELSKAYTELRIQYNRLTEEEKRGDFGKALDSSLKQIKQRIDTTKKDLADVGQELSGSRFGQVGNIIDTLGNKLGISGNLTEMLTSKTALLTAGLGAAAAAIGKATEQWIKYNSELSKQDQITSVTTGLTGGDANRMTDTMRALSDTYNIDFREAINAANTLMTQFGASGDEAIQLIKDGMQGMILGDGQKLLSMIQQYAPSFRDAGVSASQLVAIIHNSEGGIFTDQNMNAIVMGIKNIRLMTKATSDALAKMGIDGEEMSRKLTDGSMTIFDALRQVSRALQGAESGSKAVGEVMQTVFGRQGAAAGQNLAKAIDTLNTNLDETKQKTGELGEAYADLQEANEKLNVAIRDCFEYDGWEEMATGIETKLVTALSSVLEKLASIKSVLTDSGAWDAYKKGLNGGLQVILKTLGPLGTIAGFGLTSGGGGNGNTKVLGAAIGKIATQTPTEIVSGGRGVGGGGGGNSNKNKVAPQPIEGSIDWQAKKVQDLQKAWRAAADDDSRKKIKAEIESAQIALDKMTGKSVGIDGLTKMQGTTAFTPTLGDPIKGAMNGGAELRQKLRVEIDEENLKADTATLSTLVKDSIKNGIMEMDVPFDALGQDIAKGINVPDEAWQAILDQYNALREQIGLEPIQVDLDTGKIKEAGKDAKTATKDFGHAASAISSVGSALSSIEDPSAKVMGIVAQAIGTVAMSFASALGGDSTTKGNIWAFIAAAAASTAAMITMISQIHSATGYAQGGFVKGGGHFSGDDVPIMANEGELVLTRAQQGNLASQLQDGGAGGGRPMLTHVTGEQIWVALSAYTRRSGKGEIVTWR